MTNLSDADLAEIEAVAKAATPGPWEDYGYERKSGDYAWVLAHPNRPYHELNVVKVCHDDWPPTSADAAYIARMDPATTLALLAWGKRAEDAVARVREVHVESSGGDPYGDYIDHRACRHCRKAWPCPTVAALDADAAAGDAG